MLGPVLGGPRRKGREGGGREGRREMRERRGRDGGVNERSMRHAARYCFPKMREAAFPSVFLCATHIKRARQKTDEKTASFSTSRDGPTGPPDRFFSALPWQIRRALDFLRRRNGRWSRGS